MRLLPPVVFTLATTVLALTVGGGLFGWETSLLTPLSLLTVSLILFQAQHVQRAEPSQRIPGPSILALAVIGLGLSCLIGVPTGWALGTWTWLRELLDSWVQVLMAVPPIVLVVVGMIWLGPTAEVVILVVTLVTLPLLVASMRDAVLNVDGDLLEMATVFSKSRPWTIRRVILPAVAPPVLSALTVAVGQSVRVTVMAELLSTPTGLGAEVQQARTNLETADVFALSAMMAALTLVLELCLLRPLRRRLMAWSSQPS